MRVQGMVGANFGPNLMSAVGIKDTIARGLAAAATAGGLGTASLTSKVGCCEGAVSWKERRVASAA